MSIKDSWKNAKTRGEFACAFQDIIERNKENLTDADFVHLSTVNQVTYELRELVETQIIPLSAKTRDELNVLLRFREGEILKERAKLMPKIPRITRSVVRDALDLVSQIRDFGVDHNIPYDEILQRPMDFVRAFVDVRNAVYDRTTKKIDFLEQEVQSLRKKFDCNVR